MPSRPVSRTFDVHFDDAAFDEDLAHATPAGREVAQAARNALTQSGAPVSTLRPCLANARDGTNLPNCLKTYLPPPGRPMGHRLRGPRPTATASSSCTTSPSAAGTPSAAASASTKQHTAASTTHS